MPKTGNVQRSKKRTFHPPKKINMVMDSQTTPTSPANNNPSTSNPCETSSSHQKLNDSISQPHVIDSDSCEGYRLWKKSIIVDWLQHFPCPSCFKTSGVGSTFRAVEKLSGIDSELFLVCNLCNQATPV